MVLKNHKGDIPETENREVVIQANHIGVSFSTHQKDDLKSHLFRFAQKKGKVEEKKEVWPLTNINFTGYKGEILGIIGPNGAGKTTLCKIISGILRPEKGKMFVDGKVSALFSFGMGFNKELSGRDNVYLNGMMLGISKDKITRYIDDIHAFSELGKFIDQPMKYYSSGMKARLGFSVAAHLEPEVLILDEALNTGDVSFSQKAAEKMKELVKKAKIVIIVTHSLKYAKKNCDRLLWLDDGVIRDEGDPAEIIKKYKATVPPKPAKKNRNLELEKTETTIRDHAVVKAENLGISYELGKETFWALKNVTFDIKEGEVVGIIGHNGAGKSTLCKVLTNILAPDDGTVELNGETTALLGYGTGFSIQITGSDNIYLNGMLLGIPKKIIDENYDSIVEFSGLKKAINKPVKSYSSGMRARLGFSIAATLQPDIFIIDEALSTGDFDFRQKASEKIQDMMEQAKAVIVVSHNMSFVEKLCTRVIWMSQGQIVFDGDPKTAVAKYKEEAIRKKGTKKGK
jgi:teichoic acid transport system ATP-binding protein